MFALHLNSCCLFYHRVCRRWRRIVSDKFLWQDIDLSPYVMKKRSLNKFCKKHFTSMLHSLCLNGFHLHGMSVLCSFVSR